MVEEEVVVNFVVEVCSNVDWIVKEVDFVFVVVVLIVVYIGGGVVIVCNLCLVEYGVIVIGV